MALLHARLRGLRVSRPPLTVPMPHRRAYPRKKLRMQTSPQITDPISDSGSASVSSAPAETALFDLPDATPWTHLIAAWLFGAVVLAGLVVFIMHFCAIEILVATLRRARPAWLAAAVSCQMATYVCAAAIWFRVLGRAGSPLPFLSLLRLALVELFANQAIPPVGSVVALWSCAASRDAALPPQLPLRRSSLPRCRTTPPISWSARSLSSCLGIAVT